MAQPDREQRVSQLLDAIRKGTDREVFFVMPLLFPAPVLKAAKDAGACTEEINAFRNTADEYSSATEAERNAFPEVHAPAIRVSTEGLITCLHQYYENGHLAFPSKRSNNSTGRRR